MQSYLIDHISKLNISEALWNQIVSKNETNTIFQTYHWFHSWWKVFGEQNRLFFISIHDKDKIIGLAPLMIKYLFNLIKEFKKEKKSITLVEQNAIQALRVCDRAYIMQEGHFVLSGSPNELMQTDMVREVYLGG